MGGHNRTLVKLELQSNEIGAKGTSRLAWALQENTSLRSFTLQDNLEDKEAYAAPRGPPPRVAGLAKAAMFRTPRMARTKARQIVMQQLAINADTGHGAAALLAKDQEAKRRRVALTLTLTPTLGP